MTMASIFGGITILGSMAGSYFFGQLAINNRAGEIEGDVKVLKNEDINLNKRFDTFEKNIGDRFTSFEAVILKALDK